MASSSVVKVAWGVFIMCMVLAAPHAEASVTCGTVANSLAPCVAYLRGKGPLVPGCCSGVRSLNTSAKTTSDRQTACRCLKSAAGNIPGVNYSLASSLPSKCGVSIPYKISPTTDCTRVK